MHLYLMIDLQRNKKKFYKDIDDCNLVTIEEYDNRGRCLRIKEALIRLIAPIL